MSLSTSNDEFIILYLPSLDRVLPQSVIREMLRLEKALDECLDRLRSRINDDFFDEDMDDLDSITSGGMGSATASMSNRVVRFTVQERQVERLQADVRRLEKENAILRDEILDLKRRFLGDQDVLCSEEKKGDDRDFPGRVALSEGGVWNVVKQHNFENPASASSAR